MKRRPNPTAGVAPADESHQQPVMLLDVVRQQLRLRHFSYFTEKQYISWIRRFVRFHKRRHPKTMGEAEIEAFLSYLAINREVSSATQNQALNALVFLFREVLQRDLGQFRNIRWAKQSQHIPVVLTRREVERLLKQLEGDSCKWLIASLLYGCGLRLIEALRLRVKDIDFGQMIIVVRNSKGNKDRAVPMPNAVIEALKRQIDSSLNIHKRDLEKGFGRVSMPPALARKYPNAETEFIWQYVFPSTKISRDPRSGILKRHHLFNSIMEDTLAVARVNARLC